MSFNIDADKLKTIFPFHIAFNSKMELLQFGDSMEKVCPEIQQAEYWEDCFQIHRPKLITDTASLQRFQNNLFVVKCIHHQLEFKGSILFLEESDTYLFLATPIIRDVASLADQGIGLNDFAKHDPFIDFMFLMQTRDKSIQEIEEYIEKLKKKNKELDRLKLCLDHAEDGVFMFDSETLIFFYLNQGAVEQTGYSIDELLGMSAAQIEPEFNEESFRSMIAPMKRGDEVSHKFETYHQHKNGALIPVEITLQLVPCLDVTGGYFLAIVRDITERRKSEMMLRKLSQAVQQAGESILITDINGIIEYTNPAFTDISGYLPEDVIGKDPSILKSGAQDPSFYKEIWETISSGDSWHGSLIDKKRDGSFYPAMMSISPIYDEEDKVTHYVALQQDMTEHYELEEKLQQAQKMEAIGTLVGGIAHDFNNMLAGITGNVFLAKKKVNDVNLVTEKLKNVEILSNRAANMISQLLTFSRKDTVRMNTFAIAPFFREALKLAQSGIPENINLTHNISAQNLLIHGDNTQLQQLVMNLLNNARDAVVDVSQPAIHCQLEPFTVNTSFKNKHPELKKGGFVCLTISDNGYGIPQDKQDNIFDPFFTTKGVGKGTGLGLSMVFGAVQRHNGVIELESEEGKGTTFYIYLPLEEQKDEIIISKKATETARAQGETILLVDDEKAMRSAIGEVLRSLGYKVLEAADGEEALNIFSSNLNAIDLVITDVVMPKKGGVELSKAVRQLDGNMPIIFATGYDKDQALEGDDHLDNSLIISKPFSFNELSQLIRTLIEPE